MAVSGKLAGVFSLSHSRMLVAVFVCRAEGILERRRAAMGQINVGREENRCFLGRRFKPQSAGLSGRLQWRSIVLRALKESRFVKQNPIKCKQRLPKQKNISHIQIFIRLASVLARRPLVWSAVNPTTAPKVKGIVDPKL